MYNKKRGIDIVSILGFVVTWMKKRILKYQTLYNINRSEIWGKNYTNWGLQQRAYTIYEWAEEIITPIYWLDNGHSLCQKLFFKQNLDSQAQIPNAFSVDE